MWNKEGTTIMTFLTQYIADMESLRQDLANQVLNDTPGVGRMSAFIHRLSKVRELLPVCVALRDKLSMAALNKQDLLQVVIEQRVSLLEAAVEYRGMGASDAEHYARLALTVFANELAEFTDEQTKKAA